MEVLPIVLSQNKIKNKYSMGVLFLVNILVCTPQLAGFLVVMSIFHCFYEHRHAQDTMNQIVGKGHPRVVAQVRYQQNIHKGHEKSRKNP
jgi:hypothetical protein